MSVAIKPSPLPDHDAPPVAPSAEHRSRANSSLRMHFSELFAATGDRVATLTFYLVMASVIVLGRYAELDRYITPEYGLGYALGIVGGSLMLILLIYPLRKRMPRLRWLGGAGSWFKAHMIMGVLGPVCILYHCNFSLGAMNSNVALVCMLVVSGSGLFGRYFYTRIHYGLYGSKASRAQLAKDVEIMRGRLAILFQLQPELARKLTTFEQAALIPIVGEFRTLQRALLIGLRSHWVYAVVTPLVKRAVNSLAVMSAWDRASRERHLKESLQLVQVYLELVRKHAQISFFERLFALWHVLHVPLFAMMVVAAIAHIIAVHIF
jgi:hypothetical protein